MVHTHKRTHTYTHAYVYATYVELRALLQQRPLQYLRKRDTRGAVKLNTHTHTHPHTRTHAYAYAAHVEIRARFTAEATPVLTKKGIHGERFSLAHRRFIYKDHTSTHAQGTDGSNTHTHAHTHVYVYATHVELGVRVSPHFRVNPGFTRCP